VQKWWRRERVVVASSLVIISQRFILEFARVFFGAGRFVWTEEMVPLGPANVSNERFEELTAIAAWVVELSRVKLRSLHIRGASEISIT
jgi:hypothetical protein